VRLHGGEGALHVTVDLYVLSYVSGVDHYVLSYVSGDNFCCYARVERGKPQTFLRQDCLEGSVAPRVALGRSNLEVLMLWTPATSAAQE
jgi:hypothetical protein